MSGVIGPKLPLTVADVTVGTRIVVYSVLSTREVGRFTIRSPAVNNMDGKFEIEATPTLSPGCSPILYNACFLGLVEKYDCEHSRLDPRVAYFDPTPE